MPAVSETRVVLSGPIGGVSLYISLLPRNTPSNAPPLLENERGSETEPEVPPIQLLEGGEYFYEWTGVPAEIGQVVADPVEVFQPDSISGLKGRLRPGLFTGTLTVTLSTRAQQLGDLELEVRSRKLTYRLEYRWMLRDIANQITELVMDRFAVSGLTFGQDPTRDAIMLYERFAFLRELMTSETFQSALAEITRRPHVAWEELHELVRPGAPTRSDSYTQRQLAGGPRPRAFWQDGPISSLPIKLDRRRTEATHDTTPNRFVKFALERWRQVVVDIGEELSNQPESPTKARGLIGVSHLVEHLDIVLHQELFSDLSPIARFPSDNQVLQRREGYREVFRAYLEFELAARLSWTRTEQDYVAGQRDVATLYEYWVFLQVADVVAKLVGQTFDLRPLVEPSGDGLNVVLRSGKETVVRGFVERMGRRLEVELCFNRTFGNSEFGSWTRPMRPDFSLTISAADHEPAGFDPIVLLFDAKYRVQFVEELFGGVDEIVDTDAVNKSDEINRGGVLRTDLLKMHAYRDAIRRAAGAYVLYPGADDPLKREFFPEYHELLPGLGAFVLRPTADGHAIGVASLRTFIDQVLDHVAIRLTQHERSRYWLREVYQPHGDRRSSASEIALGKPLATTPVLLGYVKSAAHWDWIMKRQTYNVRTEGRAGGVAANADILRSRFLLLYCPDKRSVAFARIVSDPELVTKDAMNRTAYPEPRGDYLCVQWGWAATQEWVSHLNGVEIDEFVQRRGLPKGAPISVPWSDVERLGELASNRP